MSLSPILCAYNGSRASAVALARALDLAAPGDELALLAVVWRVGIGPSERAALSPEHAAAALADAAALAEGAGLRVERVVDHAPDAAGTILSWARDHRLLVLGAPPGSRATGILAGSVASVAIHRAPGPLLLARGALEQPGFPQRIVVASDGSLDAQMAVGAVADLAGAGDARVTLLHVRDQHDVEDRLAEQATYLDERLAHAPERVTVTGQPHDAIAHFAADAGADLLVVGSRGLRGARALGSTSERVAHEAAMSVLVMRPAPEPRGVRLARAAEARELAEQVRDHGLEERLTGGRLAVGPPER